jgi:hypothetical protein
MPINYIHSLSEVLNARRPLDVPYFGSKLKIVYNPGAFDDELVAGLQEAEQGDLFETIAGLLVDRDVEDAEELAREIVEAVQNIAGQKTAAAYILDALKQTVIEVDLVGEDGKPVDTEEILERIPLPLRGAIFTEITVDMRDGQKKSEPTARKPKPSKPRKSSFAVTS